MPDYPYKSLADLMAALDDPVADLILIGDGAGQGWDKPAAWAVAAIDISRGTRWALTGGCSLGTVNWAEAEPYVRALAYDLHHVHQGRLEHPRRVLIITDSDYTAKVGTGQYRSNKNGETWAAIRFFVDSGYELDWRWMTRNRDPLSVAVDQASKNADAHAEHARWLTEELYDLLPAK